MKAVNLLPHEEATRRSGGRIDPLAVGGAALTVVVAAGVAGGFFLEHRHAGSEQQQLSAAQTQLAQARARQPKPTPGRHARVPVLTTPSVTAQEQPWRDAVATALSTRIAWDRVLREFSQVVPSDITVSNLKMGAPGSGTSSSSSSSSSASSTTAASTGAFSLQGEAYSEDGVARLLSRLMLVPDLTGVSLTSSEVDPTSGNVSFQIQAQVKGAPAAPAAAATGAPTTGTGTTGATTTGTTTTGSSQ